MQRLLASSRSIGRRGFVIGNESQALWKRGLHVRFFAGSAVDEFSDDEYGFEDRQGNRSYANVDGWKWKLSVLIQNPIEREIITREKKDKRDYQCLASLAKRMGLYSQSYGKAMVFSKDPLPNYRPDMDDQRPLRKVSIPSAVYHSVSKLLTEHLERKDLFRFSSPTDSLAAHDNKEPFITDQLPCVENLSKQPLPGDDMLLLKKSMHLRDKQQAWQESTEGQKMMTFRKSLPAYNERDLFLSAVKKHQVLVVSGETGCGKTTQLPQYILESEIETGHGGSCSIICTQPRKISAISVAERVAAERGEELGETVGYKVRLEGVKGVNTRLLFCTTGILLRRLMADPDLKGVSHVIVDEIHERGMNEDFLLIVLKDLLPRRLDLRVVLMSATLNAKLFSSFFGGAPMCHLQGFTYPVNIHFLEDILEMKGYRFSDDNQIDDYGQDKEWKTQQQMNKRKKGSVATLAEGALVKADLQNYSGATQYSISQWNPECLGFNLIEAVLCHICNYEREGAVLVFMTGWEDINALRDHLKQNPILGDSKNVLMLLCHGAMASADQKMIFEPAPRNVRKIVLATNLAETSITINDVVFVVDCGKAKVTSYDALNNTPCLTPNWISKASVRQRRGRAGRVQSGECYHLYPRVVYEAFAEYQEAELLRTPLHSLCLQIKSLKLGTIRNFLAKALQAPDPLSVHNAVELLKTIGALDSKEELTTLGIHLSNLPVEPRIGKMLIMGAIFSCLDPVLTIAAGLTIRDPFVLPTEKRNVAEAAKRKYGEADGSDHIALIRAYDGWSHAMDSGNAINYCWKNFLSFSALKAMSSLRRQFEGLLRQAGFVNEIPDHCNKNSKDPELLRAIICSGLFPGISSVWTVEGVTKFKTVQDGEVVLHQSSILSKTEKITYPWLTFHEKLKTGNISIRDSTGVSDSMLLLFGGKLEKSQKAGYLHMSDGWMEFSMQPRLAETFLLLREELEELIFRKLENPNLDIWEMDKRLLTAVSELLHGDKNEGRFAFPECPPEKTEKSAADVVNVKGALQDRLLKAGYKAPKYDVKGFRNKTYEATVSLRGKCFRGKVATTKKQAEKNAAAEALEWLDRIEITGRDQENEDFPVRHTGMIVQRAGFGKEPGVIVQRAGFWKEPGR